MAEIIRFNRTGNDPQRNLGDYVEAARSLPFLASSRVVWDDDVWDLEGLAKANRHTGSARVFFSASRLDRREVRGEALQLSKALAAWSIAERYGKPLAYTKFQKMAATMRTVAEALDEIGAACPTRISLDVAERSAEIIRAGDGTAAAVEQRLDPLWVIARTLNEAGIPQVFFDWSPGGRPANVRRARARPEPSRSLTTDELEAIAEAWRRATRPDHRIVMNVLALLCGVPA